MEEDAEAIQTLGPTITQAEIESIPGKLTCLRAGLWAAASDGKLRTGLPGFLPVAALLPAGRPALAEVVARAESGFRVFKWKVGVADIGDELGLLDDLLAALPSGSKLRLDANGAWDRRRAERWLERCADRPIEFVEQPVAADSKGAQDLLLGLAADYPTPLALDESLVRAGDAERWLGAGWPGIFVVKISLFGGADRVLGQLAAAKARVVFSSALETAVGARSSLSAAFAWPGVQLALGFGVWPLFADPKFDGPASAPFIRREDVERIDPEAVWNALI
jgi:O-succinylbenzoate synthase